jgi:thiol-disulfide isomerase/thioredoxin
MKLYVATSTYRVKTESINMQIKHMGGLLSTLAIAVLLLTAGCGDGGAASSIAPTATLGAGAAPKIAKPVLAVTDLVVGHNRFVFGLADETTGQPINDTPQVTIQFFRVHADGTATKMSDASVVAHKENLPAFLFVAQADFPEAGDWGALLTIQREGQAAYQSKLEFKVVADSAVPMIGEVPPLSNNQTIKDDPTLDNICSAQPHDDMHKLTIADAAKSGKPTLILFAAPGFCPSFTCGPNLEIAQALEQKYRDKVNFIHIETPNTIQDHRHTLPVEPNHRQNPGHYGVLLPDIPTMTEWGLQSEPWIFLLDNQGKVASRFEGGLTLDQVEPDLAKLVK